MDMDYKEAIFIITELYNEVRDTKIMKALALALKVLKEKEERSRYPSELARIIAEHDEIDAKYGKSEEGRK